MKDDAKSVTRREFVGAAAIVLPALAGLLVATTAPASAKSTQSSVAYQPKPNGSKQCSKCRFFVAGSSATANGTCQVVAGAISPKGYCNLYVAKS